MILQAAAGIPARARRRVAAFVDSIGRKTWTDEAVRKYVGPFEKSYFSHATDADLRTGAASGGSTTALLLRLLESGEVDGALVLRSVVRNGRVACEFFIARSRAELISAQGSKYMAVRFGHDALPLILAFDGRLAVVALPCDCTLLRRVRQRDPVLDEKIKLVIALACGHNSEPELTHHVVSRIGRGRGELTQFTYRTGHWRGQLTAKFKNGEQIVRPFSEFSNYRNLYICAQRKCHSCHDHFGYDSDLSVGDIWSLKMRRHPIKHTFLVTRSAAGQAAVDAAVSAGELHCHEEDIREILDGQSRTLPFHYNTAARARVGRLFGIHVRDTTGERVRLTEYATAFVALLNERVSRTRPGRKLLLLLPRPVLRVYLYFFKGMELL